MNHIAIRQWQNWPFKRGYKCYPDQTNIIVNNGHLEILFISVFLSTSLWQIFLQQLLDCKKELKTDVVCCKFEYKNASITLWVPRADLISSQNICIDEGLSE